MNVVDVGATKIAAGVISPGGGVLRRARYPTAKTPEKLLSGIIRAVSEVGDGFEVEGVCVAVPGSLMARDDAIVYSPNLHAIEGIRLKDELEPEIGLPLTIENDNNAAAWGEFRFGAGRGTDHLVYVGLGTGIGGGVVVHGLLLRGAQGAGGELGHATIHATGPRCACGNRGCLEAFASGNAIGRRGREVAVGRPESALGRLAAEREVLGEDVARLAREGDGAALRVMNEVGRWLGVGLAGFVNVFNPDVVVVGGGAMGAGELLLGPAREEVRLRAQPPSRDRVQIEEATFGPDSGMIGAAALARSPSGQYLL